MEKLRRFWVCYYAETNDVSFNFRGKMYLTKNLKINVPVKSKFNNKPKFPKFVLEGKVKESNIKFGKDYIVVN